MLWTCVQGVTSAAALFVTWALSIAGVMAEPSPARLQIWCMQGSQHMHSCQSTANVSHAETVEGVVRLVHRQYPDVTLARRGAGGVESA